jgi:hypothetical protein
MKRIAPIVYGLVVSIVLWSVFCCERGLEAEAVSYADIGLLDWMALGLTFVVVWGFVGTATAVAVEDRRDPGQPRGGQ